MEKRIIALAGNPNVGKSTVFNALTGMRQHTGNWAGKTVETAAGEYEYKGERYTLVDLPGTYSLMANSAEEEAARNFLCREKIWAAVVVCDGSCLERNLNLALQTAELIGNTILCINLLDEAAKKKITIDLEKLSEITGLTVVGVTARSGEGLEELKGAIAESVPRPPIEIRYSDPLEQAVSEIIPPLTAAMSSVKNKLPARWTALRLIEGNEPLLNSLSEHIGRDIGGFRKVKAALHRTEGLIPQRDKISDDITAAIFKRVEEITALCVHSEHEKSIHSRLDRIVTHKIWGVPIMLLLLGVVLFITVVGANYPSEWLSAILSSLGDKLSAWLAAAGAPWWLSGALIDGVYRSTAWVVSVMLPPMAIFFPLFTILEDWGYLPRVAFNLDGCFKKCGACGKQALTMCMGLGCNAVGITGCRIIDSPRERLVALLTNCFVPCNGRFPPQLLWQNLRKRKAAPLSAAWSFL